MKPILNLGFPRDGHSHTTATATGTAGRTASSSQPVRFRVSPSTNPEALTQKGWPTARVVDLGFGAFVSGAKPPAGVWWT
jgi:hypothetical protein